MASCSQPLVVNSLITIQPLIENERERRYKQLITGREDISYTPMGFMVSDVFIDYDAITPSLRSNSEPCNQGPAANIMEIRRGIQGFR